MWPNLSMTDFHLADMVCYVTEMDFVHVEKVWPIWICLNLSVTILIWPILFVADMVLTNSEVLPKIRWVLARLKA